MPAESLYQKQISPVIQAGVVLGATILIMLIVSALSDNEMHPWMISATFLFSYVIFNSALSFAYDKQGKYWLISIICYAVLLLVGILLARSLTGLSLGEAKSMKMIYIMFTVGYIVLLTIASSMKTILQLVLKQDKRLRGEE